MAAHGCTARDRVIGAAVELFAEHGVQGTSLQMIADRMGVAKGAVYYQFRSKDDLVLALLRPLFDGISALVERVDPLPAQARRDAAVTGLVDLAIQQRRATCLFRRDPVVDQLIAEHAEMAALTERFYALLLGPDPDDTSRVSMSVAVTGLYFCTTAPALRDIADADLRKILRRRFLQCVSEPVPPTASPPRPAGPQPDAALRDSALCR
ncbi:TetR/AcrR family transcriptional regulator [Mycobacterium sp. C31M]